jgi:hypothetical protein
MTDGECEQIVNAQVFYPLLFTLFQEGRDFIRGAGVYGGRIQSMHLKRGAPNVTELQHPLFSLLTPSKPLPLPLPRTPRRVSKLKKQNQNKSNARSSSSKTTRRTLKRRACARWGLYEFVIPVDPSLETAW